MAHNIYSRILDLLWPYLAHPENLTKNLAWRLPSTVSDKKYIFVIGCPRSGTTLLQRILTVHPECFSVNAETNLFSFMEIFSQRWLGFPRGHFARLLADSRDIIDFFDHLVGSLQDPSESKIFVEKTPQHILKIKFLIRHFPNSRFVHIVRDGRDCYLSSKSHPHVPQNSSVGVFAKYWKRCLVRWSHCKKHPNCYQLRYEDLALNPAKEISELCAFLGLPFHPDMTDPGAISDDPRSMQSVFRKLSEPINPGSLMRWQSEMDQHDLQVFNRVAIRELSAYNYVLNC